MPAVPLQPWLVRTFGTLKGCGASASTRVSGRQRPNLRLAAHAPRSPTLCVSPAGGLTPQQLGDDFIQVVATAAAGLQMFQSLRGRPVVARAPPSFAACCPRRRRRTALQSLFLRVLLHPTQALPCCTLLVPTACGNSPGGWRSRRSAARRLQRLSGWQLLVQPMSGCCVLQSGGHGRPESWWQGHTQAEEFVGGHAPLPAPPAWRRTWHERAS